MDLCLGGFCSGDFGTGGFVWGVYVLIPFYTSIGSMLSLRKTVGKVSPILVTLTSSRNDSNFESSYNSLKENKPDGVNPNSNYIDYFVRKNEGKILWFSADCAATVKENPVPSFLTEIDHYAKDGAPGAV